MVRRSTTGKVLANIKQALMMLMMRRISLRWDGVAVGDLGHVIELPYLALQYEASFKVLGCLEHGAGYCFGVLLCFN